MLKDILPKKKKTYPNSLVYGAIITGVASGITYYLLATKSGRDLTKKIGDKSSEVVDRVSDYIREQGRDVSNYTATSVNEGREKAERIIESARMQAEQILKHAENILKEAKSKTEL